MGRIIGAFGTGIFEDLIPGFLRMPGESAKLFPSKYAVEKKIRMLSVQANKCPRKRRQLRKLRDHLKSVLHKYESGNL